MPEAMPLIYLDNAATTRVSEACADAAYSAMLNKWGNPSSTHHLGAEANELLARSRRTVAAELHSEPERIFFTSGGTEANNTAVLGGAHALARRGKRVITSQVEHASVLESVRQLEKEGFDCVYLEPDSTGRVSTESVADALTDDTILVALMLVNNETGAINPIREISALLRRRKSIAQLHCDAVQAFGKLPVNVRELGCSTLSLSGHKIHAPKGIGALYAAKGARLNPLHIGGEQQERIRPGTEPLPLIASLAEACRRLPPEGERGTRERELNEHLRERLMSDEFRALAPDSVILSPSDGSPSILSVATGCVKSETMLNYLSSRGIYISAGSACSKGKQSHVFSSLGREKYIGDSALRISFCPSNTIEETDALYSAVAEALKTLVRFR